MRIDVEELIVLLKCIKLNCKAQLLNDYARTCADVIPVGQVAQPPSPLSKQHAQKDNICSFSSSSAKLISKIRINFLSSCKMQLIKVYVL